ncbi:MAG: DUF3857 domain-containing protein [Acidobacteriota bacterium]
MFPRLITLILLCLFASLSIFAGDDAPAWLRQAAAIQPPIYEKNVNAVVLHKETQVTLDSDGKLSTTENYAVKILSREGRNEAVAIAFYLVSTGKIREINGWLIRSDGTTKEYNKKTIIDQISDPDDIYNEGRIKIIDASNDADAGSVFGYTIVSEEPPLFYQDLWRSQDDLPTILSRHTLNLPKGWKATSVTFNHENVAPQIAGTSYTWELRNLPPIPTEPMSPSFINLAPFVAINYAPENSSQAVNKAFANWTEVSRWASGMYDPQVIINDEIAAKAKELTANAQTELEKIQAIGKYVQNLQYISIDIGVGYGNGMRPRPSNLVMSRGYGDCKDKANLMRAMLKVLKIEAYPVAIYSGDSTKVREEWASPSQFNHCIIAVKVSDSTQSSTITNHPQLGRLLIFDATDPFTPVGDLPDYLQGSFALIMAGDNGGLSKMPVTPPDFNVWKRKIDVNLGEDGSIQGTISERTSGQSSTNARAMVRSLSMADFNSAIERWLTRGATGAKLVKITSEDKQEQVGFNLDIEFAAKGYGQLMQGRLLVFKPAIVNRADSIYLTEKTRTHPVVFDSDSFDETVVFNLPQGFVVDEIPDAITLETSFGKYTSKYETKDGKLFYSRSLITKRTVLPVDKYSSVRDFYSKILSAEQSPVVLLKK